jgi:hypothetical protein
MSNQLHKFVWLNLWYGNLTCIGKMLYFLRNWG